ncbi:ComEC/Rec2 family competence protein [Clostridium sp. SYSU_GA19001]|uniref:ComEC/Rec2 family competence protein n=1 Tax=Clostridium caldaquaticum TaxID=2940653 RepID=UPI0020778379|nr:ComEC/Rec2 family competence protein [Clostridium caldaquaticum]MCM8710393.1 ComEC/Rec2 family competence protein [Clostridium caldaquaticum]
MKLTKPLVFYAVAIFIGTMSYIVSKDYKILGAALAASFLIIVFFTIEKKFFIVIICFFAMGIISCFMYFNYYSFGKFETIRLINNKEFYSIGTIDGKLIKLKGNLENLKEGDRIFAYGNFYNKKDYYKGIIGEFYIQEFKLYKSDVISKLYELKRKAYEEFYKYLGEEKAAIIMSLCFGETDYLSIEQKYDFQKLGVVHAISVSGFHMAIIYKILEGVLGIIPSIIISFLYMVFTGAQPATMRAFIMILVLKLSKKLFKSYDAVSALSLSAILILTLKPYYVFDLGFMLSYLSTLGIILFYKKIRKGLYKLPKSINESLSLTLSAQVYSMPFAALTMENLSFGFIPGNLVLIPIYTVMVVAGNLALIFIKLKFLFELICKLLYLVLIILDGADYLLLKITPPISYMSYLDSMVLLGIIISFILVKKGFDKFKFVPLYMIFFIVIQYYSFFPKIEFISAGNASGVIVNYKWHKIFIYDGSSDTSKALETIKKRFHITRVVCSTEDKAVMRLNRYCSIRFSKFLVNKANSINIEVDSYNAKTIITSNSAQFKDVDLTNYDIIVLPERKYYYATGNNMQKFYVKGFKIIYRKVYPIYSINN